MAKEKEQVPSRVEAQSPDVPVANAPAAPGVAPVPFQPPQPAQPNEGEGGEANFEQSAKRAALRETADAARKRADEAKDKADKALAEAQKLAADAADLNREAQNAEAAADPSRARYIVAEGKSLHTRAGHLGAFQEVSAHHFQGGSEELERHIKSGFVVLRR